MMSCGNSKESTAQTEDTAEKSVERVAKKAIVTQDWNQYRASAPYNIQTVSLKGNLLTVNITYSGGCKPHEFDLVGSAFIMKSMPPKRGIKLYHHPHEDDCREQVSQSLIFDITDFGYQNSEIILNLEHYPEALRYTVQK